MYCEIIEQAPVTETFNYFHIQNIIHNEGKMREFRSSKVHIAMYRFAKILFFINPWETLF